MVIISTSAVAAIIQAVSPASIFDAGAPASISAKAGVANTAGNANAARRDRFFMVGPPGCRSCLSSWPRLTARTWSWILGPWILKRVRVGLAGADAQRVLDVDDEDLAVADLPGLCRGGDRLDHAVGAIVRDHDFDLDLGQEVHRVLRAAVDLGVALLAAEALHLGNGQSRDAECGERVAHVLQLERLDDGGDQLHGDSCLFGPEPGGPAVRGYILLTLSATEAYFKQRMPLRKRAGAYPVGNSWSAMACPAHQPLAQAHWKL